MEKMMLSLKNIYKLLMNNDFPIYSDSVISEADRKGQTMLRFWQNQLVAEFRCLPNGKMIWKNDGKRNRYTSHLCNRNTEMKCYTEYAMEIAAKVSVSSLSHQIACFTEFLQGRKHRHEVLLRRIQEFVRLTEAEDLGVTKEIAEHIRESVEMPEWLKQCGVSGSLFQAAYLLTMLTLYAAAGEEMGSPALAVLRTKEYNMKALWEEYIQLHRSKENASHLLTIHSGLLQDNPLPPHRFFGREAELFDLKEIAATGRKCLITGIGGLGKTELLRQLIRLCEEEKVVDKIAVVPYETSILKSFARCFSGFQYQDPENSFRTILRRLEKESEQGKVLLLIDNLTNGMEEDPELERLLELNCTVLVTTRRGEIKGFETYNLGSTTISAGVLIFRDNYGQPLSRGEQAALTDILKDEALCHPLTLRLMARAARCKNWSIQELKKQLEKNGISFSWQEEERTVRLSQIYRQLYSYMQIPEKCQPLAELFALLPRDSYSGDFLEEYFSHIMGQDAEQKLAALTEGGWLDADESGWSMHPLIAQCLRNKSITWDKLESIMQRLLEYWTQRKENDLSIYDDQDAQRNGSILLYTASFGSGNISRTGLIAVIKAMGGMFLNLQSFEVNRQWLELLLKRCIEQDDEMEVRYYSLLGRYHLGNTEDYVKIYQKQKEHRTVSERVFWNLCQFAGETMMFRKEYTLADEMFLEILHAEAIPEQKASAYLFWTICAEQRGDAEEALRRAIWGKDYVMAHPECGEYIRFRMLSTACNIYVMFGRKDEVGMLLAEVKKLLNSRTLPMDSAQYNSIAGTYELYFGDLVKALEHYQNAAQTYEEYLGKDTTYYTIAGQIAIVLQRMKRYEEAVDTYLELLEYAKEVKNAHLQHLFSNNISVAYLELGQPEEALKHLDNAIGFARKQGGIALAEALRNRARAYGQLGDEKQEYICLEEASPLLEEAYGVEHPRAEAARQRLAELEGKKIFDSRR